jgi:predicted nucleotidyltransferase
VGEITTIDGVVARFKQRLALKYQVHTLILFGSRIRGEGDEWSDYDFIIVSPDFRGVSFLQRRRGLVALREPGVSFDFFCYTPEEYQAKVQELGIVREAAKTGVRLT